MNEPVEDRPAILGGTPVRPLGPPEWPILDEQIRSVLLNLAQSGEWGRYHGPHGPDLISRLADYHQIEHVHLCSSGTAAIELALRGAGVGAGHEVVLAGYDFKSNFQNVLCVGAVPVLVDLDPQSWQMDPDRFAAAITSQTRAVIVSHLHGGHVDVAKVRRIAQPHGIVVVEDACQNPGALLSGRRAGAAGDVGVLSFGGSKLLTAGRGGAVLTSRTEIAERIKRHVLRGNDAYPLSEMQAAILVPQLLQLDEANDRRRLAVQTLYGELKAVRGLTMLQSPAESVRPAYYKLGFRYQSDEFGGMSRDLFIRSMRAEGIALDPGFRSLHLIHAARRFRAADSLAEATRADSQMVTLHHPVLLAGDRAIDEIVIALKNIARHAKEISAAIVETSERESTR